ncbi:nucleoside-diphosphate-sugar epimerase [Actinopolyspora biskrensis]|uniref:Nucleoside-diphosphate-sugar epimerase n=1 Tax=Actinopolyspora biskrensis TaxID=1470178 RepID=A0A852Z6E2_9ACTN|nr:NAD-dependent epimerase/dehydratase family protein [Actinopolyspora biskrensis]NYH80925.1 nucleoside-diphosphate-sugar epimerase [Actinopolyspora biskrensis]
MNLNIGDRHPDVTVIAAGVTNVGTTSAEEFDREATLVYEALRRCRAQGRTVVFFSTASAGMYGATDSPGTEEGAVFPSTAYGRHKLGLERVLATSGADWLALRVSHVVGSGQRKYQLMPALANQVRAGAVTLHRGAVRDLIDAEHMVSILDRLLEKGVSGEVFNLASGFSYSVEEIVGELESSLGVVASKSVVESPTENASVSVGKIREYVPEFEEFGFGPGYLSLLLDRYLSTW